MSIGNAFQSFGAAQVKEQSPSFLYIIHVIQSSDCEVFFLINDLSI